MSVATPVSFFSDTIIAACPLIDEWVSTEPFVPIRVPLKD